ncbi:MAG TPA: DUF6683 family protein [Pyrinomonadaceae bacterium]|jgi:hypothetical protein|nr:DUF6683 family protein [Pyrinomonadaceae bacterium]
MKRLFLLALCMSACAVGARAQTMMDLSTIDLGIQQIQDNTFVFNSINQGMAVGSGDSSGRTNSRRRPAPGAPNGGTTGGAGHPVAAGQTTFRPVAASIMPQRLGAQMGRTPQERERLEKFFALLLKDYKEMAVQRGAPLNDVARASSFAVGTSYDVYNEGRMLGDKAFQAVRAQMYEALAASPKFRAMGDRERQEMYESYIILGQFVSAAYESAGKTNDKELANKMHNLARIMLEGAFGVSVERLRFTDEGVRF